MNASDWIATGALALSVYTYVRHSRLERRILLKQIKDADSADIRIRAERRQNYCEYVISNHGQAEATNITVDLKAAGGNQLPYHADEVAEKLPFGILAPGDEFKLQAMTSQVKWPVSAVLKWTDGTGQRESAQTLDFPS